LRTKALGTRALSVDVKGVPLLRLPLLLAEPNLAAFSLISCVERRCVFAKLHSFKYFLRRTLSLV